MTDLTQSDYEEALTLKKAGNDCFRSRDFDGALKNYSQVLLSIGMKGSFSVDNFVNVFAQNSGAGDAKDAATQSGASDKAGDADEKKLAYNAQILRIQVLSNMATVYLQQAKWKLAIGKYDDVLALDPNNSKAQLGRAKALRKQKKFAEALKVLKALAQRFPNHEMVFIEIALAEEENSEKDDFTHNMDHKYWQQKKEREDALKAAQAKASAQGNDWTTLVMQYGVPLLVVLVAIAYLVYTQSGAAAGAPEAVAGAAANETILNQTVEDATAQAAADAAADAAQDAAAGAAE